MEDNKITNKISGDSRNSSNSRWHRRLVVPPRDLEEAPRKDLVVAVPWDLVELLKALANNSSNSLDLVVDKPKDSEDLVMHNSNSNHRTVSLVEPNPQDSELGIALDKIPTIKLKFTKLTNLRSKYSINSLTQFQTSR